MKIERVIFDDDFVGTVRRTIKCACRKQLTGDTRAAALRLACTIKGGMLVRNAPAGATVLRYAHSKDVIIPVDNAGRLVRI